jgi:hypothetical protein
MLNNLMIHTRGSLTKSLMKFGNFLMVQDKSEIILKVTP